MKSPLLYLLETLLCSGLFMGFYRLLLERKVSFALCRRFLLAALAASVLIPALRIPLYPAPVVPWPGAVEIGALPASGTVTESGQATSATPAVDWPRLARLAAAALYLVVTAVLLLRFALHLAALSRLRRGARLTPFRDYTLAVHPAVETPFSFLRTVYLGSEPGPDEEIVLRHEASHIAHRHSVERLVAQLFVCLFWFNPFFRMARTRLCEVQEWEADRDVLDAGYDLPRYRALIFQQLFGYNPDMTCGLNHAFIKNRFVMMTRFKERRFAFLRLGAAIPVVAGMMMLCSFTTRLPEQEAPVAGPVVEVRIGPEGRITINGRKIDRDSLAAYVAAEREKLSEADRARMEVRLVAYPEQRFGTLNDTRQALRKARALRVSYATPSGEPGVTRMLPPEPGKYGKVTVHTDLSAIEGRNIFHVNVSGSGSVTAGQPGRQRVIEKDELPAMVEAFVLNESDDPAGPEKTMREISLADGTPVRYPVSDGIVSLSVDRSVPYAAFIGVQRALQQGFIRARDAVARRWLGAPSYETLSEADRAAVDRAVPIKIAEAETVGKR